MRVGFLGLGAMGNPMAANLQKAGYELTIHDIRREQGRNLEDAGAVWATNPAEDGPAIRRGAALPARSGASGIGGAGRERRLCRSGRGRRLHRHQHQFTGGDVPHRGSRRLQRHSGPGCAHQRGHLGCAGRLVDRIRRRRRGSVRKVSSAFPVHRKDRGPHGGRSVPATSPSW